MDAIQPKRGRISILGKGCSYSDPRVPGITHARQTKKIKPGKKRTKKGWR